MPWKLQSPGLSGPSKDKAKDKGTENDPLAAIQAVLSIAKDSVTGLGVPGLEAAVGGLLSVLTSIKNVKDNEADLITFGKTVNRFCESIAPPLRALKTAEQPVMPNELPQRLATLVVDLDAMSSKARKLLSRGRIQKFLNNQEDAGVIGQLNLELNQTVQAFLLKGSIMTEISLAEAHQDIKHGFASTETTVLKAEASLHESQQKISDNVVLLASSTARAEISLDELKAETKGGFDTVQSHTLRTEKAIYDTHDQLSQKLDVVAEGLQQFDKAASNSQSMLLNASQSQLLRELPRAQARYDSQSRGDAHGCFEGTRTNTLNEIYAWINNEDPKTPPIFWLCGLAGIGKSTIAHTIAAEEEVKHRLGASFFFSRDVADRRNPLLVYPTIAYQLAIFNPDLKKSIVGALEQDPDVGLAVMRKQFQKLIVEPLSSWEDKGKRVVIVMDALDECYPESGAEEILVRWAAELRRISVPLKILITSRPELHIRAKFQSPSLRLISQPYILHDIEQSIVQADIELFLRHRLNQIGEDHGLPTPWPTDFELRILVRRAGILFIFAATAIKFIESGKRRDPQSRLNILLKRDVPKAPSKFQEVDSLYTQVLQHAVSMIDDDGYEEDLVVARQTFREVLEAVVLLKDPLPSSSLEALLSLKRGAVRSAITHLHSVLVVPEVLSGQIRLFHPSFHDFLTNSQRCLDPGFYLNPEESHTRLAALCFKQMSAKLQHDPCAIRNPWLNNAEVPDLQKRVDAAIPPHVQYCCLYAAGHLSQASPSDASLSSLVNSFCRTKLLVWIEYLSLLGDLDNAVTSLRVMEGWYKKVHSPNAETLSLLHDAHRVVLQFSQGIRLSSGHIYTSALPFSPPCPLQKHYSSACPLDYVLMGQPSRWNNCVSVIEQSDTSWSVAYSADGEKLAAGGSKGDLRVISSPAGADLLLLEGHKRGIRALAFSNDGSRVASASEDRSAKVWDITTGMLLATLQGHSDAVTFVAFVSDDSMVVTASDDCTLRFWHSITGAPLSCRSGQDCEISAGAVSPDGTTIATAGDGSIGIWDLHQDEPITLLTAPTKTYVSIAFLRDNQHLISGSGRNGVDLWDYRAGTLLKVFQVPGDAYCLAIAPSGAELAISCSEQSVRIWDTGSWSTVGLLEGHLGDIQSLAYSPDGTALASGSDDHSIRVWDRAGDAPNRSPTVAVGPNDWHNNLAVSANGSYVVSTSTRSRSVKIWNLVSNEPPRTVRTEECPDFVTCSPDGRLFAYEGQTDGLQALDEHEFQRLRLFRMEDLECLSVQEVERLSGMRIRGGTAFSSDGTLLTSSSLTPGFRASTVYVWSTDSDELLHVFDSDNGEDIGGLAFSSDNARLFYASTSWCGVWDMNSGAQIITVDTLDPGSVISCKYFANDTRILCLKRPPQSSTTDIINSFSAYTVDASTLSRIEVVPCGPTTCLDDRPGESHIVSFHDRGEMLWEFKQSAAQRLCWLPKAWRVHMRMSSAVNETAVPPKLKRRKLVDRSLPTGLDDVAEESALYNELQEMERNLDWTISRKRMEIQEALGRPLKGGPQRLNKGAPRKFSSFLKSMIVEIEQDPTLYNESNIVEWHRFPNQPPQDGFEIKRKGDMSVKTRIIMNLEHFPEHFKVLNPLADIINVKEETRVGIVAAFWNYIKMNGLQDKAHPTVIKFDNRLSQAFQMAEVQFNNIPELVNRFLATPDPVVLHHIISVEQPIAPNMQAFDIDVDMDDVFLKGKMNQALLSYSSEAQAAIATVDDE
ncbi:hypothetical protein FRB90_012513, partial [Tulasnella sp. 427]